MSISPALAELNVARFAAWSLLADEKNLRQAVFAFNGDVYEGLHAQTMAPVQIDYLQKHLKILSGLYGVLRPLDLIQAYRLEMGSRLPNPKGKNLYEYWGSTVTDRLNEQFNNSDSDCLINLASEELFKVIQSSQINAKVINPVFWIIKPGIIKSFLFMQKKPEV